MALRPALEPDMSRLPIRSAPPLPGARLAPPVAVEGRLTEPGAPRLAAPGVDARLPLLREFIARRLVQSGLDPLVKWLAGSNDPARQAEVFQDALDGQLVFDMSEIDGGGRILWYIWRTGRGDLF